MLFCFKIKTYFWDYIGKYLHDERRIGHLVFCNFNYYTERITPLQNKLHIFMVL